MLDLWQLRVALINYSCLIVSSVNDRLHPDYSLEGRTVVYRWRTPQSDSLPESKERGFHVSRSELSTMNVAMVQEAQNYTPTTNESSRKRDTQLSRDDISKGEMQLRTNAWSNELRTIKLHLWGSDCVRRALSGLAETARTRKKSMREIVETVQVLDEAACSAHTITACVRGNSRHADAQNKMQ